MTQTYAAHTLVKCWMVGFFDGHYGPDMVGELVPSEDLAQAAGESAIQWAAEHPDALPQYAYGVGYAVALAVDATIE